MLEVAHAAQHLAGLFDGVLQQLRRLRMYGYVDRSGETLRIDQAVDLRVGAAGNQGHALVRPTEGRNLLDEDADHLELATVQKDGLADRIGEREQLQGEGIAEHRHPPRSEHVHARQVAALADELRIVFRILRRPTAQRDVGFGGDALVGRDLAVVPDLGAHQVHGADLVANRLGFIQRDRWPLLRRAPLLVAVEAVGPLLYLECLRAQHGHFLFDRGLHDRDGGHHADDGSDPEHDADQGQE